MTTELTRQYYSDRTYYKIEIDRDIDNPDQRLTEDVASFTKVSLAFFITLMPAAIALVSFSGILSECAAQPVDARLPDAVPHAAARRVRRCKNTAVVEQLHHQLHLHRRRLWQLRRRCHLRSGREAR